MTASRERIPGTGELADMAELWKLGNPSPLDPADMLASARLAYDQAMDRGDVDAINTAEQRLVGIYEAHPELYSTQDGPAETQSTRKGGRSTFLHGLDDPDNGIYTDF